MLLRLALRPDRLLIMAVLGTAAAILLPVVGTLVLAGLEPRAADDRQLAIPDDGTLDAASLGEALLVLGRDPSQPGKATFLTGPPLVAAGDPRSAASLNAPLADSRDQIVHPSELPGAEPVLALLPGPATIPGAQVVPARGADAFEATTLNELREQGFLLILLSMPTAALVAAAFAAQEARSRRRRAATLVALGGTSWARGLLAGRVAIMSLLAVAVAAAAGALLWAIGPALFHPTPTPKLRLALALLLPGAAAFGAGLAAVLRAPDASALRGAARDVDADPNVTLPLRLRPILIGVRIVPILLLAGALFLADVGFPAAAAVVPSSLAGGAGEWVVGAGNGLTVGVGVPAAVAAVAALDPRVEAIVAESVAPTLLDGRPVVLRGGLWSALATYHGLTLISGAAPSPGSLVLGESLARRTGLHLDDLVWVQSSHGVALHRFTISGIASAPELLKDEAFASEPDGRLLAGIPAGQATLVRFRPQSVEAREAVFQEAANLVVASVTAPAAPAGSIAPVRIEVANLGLQPGERTLTVRVDDRGVATTVARLGSHARTTVEVPILVPSVTYRVEVNPTDEATGIAGPTWSTRPASTGEVAARLQDGDAPRAGVAVGLYGDLEAASADRPFAVAVTDSNGEVLFANVPPGTPLVGTRNNPRLYLQLAVGGPNLSLRVTSIWTEPAAVVVGEAATLAASVHNFGDGRRTANFTALAGELPFGVQELSLDTGATATLRYRLFLGEPVDFLEVGGVRLSIGTTPPSAGAATETPPAPSPSAQAGQVAQAVVANRVLGDAQGALAGFGATAIATSLAVVALGTRRALLGRRHVADLLTALGQDAGRIRSRAALEAGLLAAACFVALILPAKLLFAAVGHWGPTVFGHGYPDPLGFLFVVQTGAAFVGAAALASYLAAGWVTRDT